MNRGFLKASPSATMRATSTTRSGKTFSRPPAPPIDDKNFPIFLSSASIGQLTTPMGSLLPGMKSPYNFPIPSFIQDFENNLSPYAKSASVPDASQSRHDCYLPPAPACADDVFVAFGVNLGFGSANVISFRVANVKNYGSANVISSGVVNSGSANVGTVSEFRPAFVEASGLATYSLQQPVRVSTQPSVQKILPYENVSRQPSVQKILPNEIHVDVHYPPAFVSCNSQQTLAWSSLFKRNLGNVGRCITKNFSTTCVNNVLVPPIEVINVGKYFWKDYLVYK